MSQPLVPGSLPITALDALPPVWPEALRASNASAALRGRKIVVLDDDPTGTQTVHDLWVLTQWTDDLLRTALAPQAPTTVYILTNSRSLPRQAAVELTKTIVDSVLDAARQVGVEVDFVSRGDSTLRGHYPAETDAIVSTLRRRGDKAPDALILCPFFAEGKRFTLDDVHYVKQGDALIPAAMTEFAGDKTFGYRASDLRQWVAEKTQGRIAGEQVDSISLDLLRRQGPQAVARRLRMNTRPVVIINAVCPEDLDVVVAGIRLAEAEGSRWIFRTAASFVRHYAGISPRPLLNGPDLSIDPSAPGLIAVGSYVPKSSEQLRHLLRAQGVAGIELNVEAVLDDRLRESEIARVSRLATESLGGGLHTVIHTSRATTTRHGQAGELSIAGRVSSAMVRAVGGVGIRPGFVIAKGGITSSDVATGALGVRRAWVLGQLLPGVPVWKLGDETRWPGVAYVVFPGNVGEPDWLREALCRLTK